MPSGRNFSGGFFHKRTAIPFELAKQYAEHPEKRLALTALIPGENKDDPNVERSGDVKTLDLSQLKKDYEEAKKSLEKQAQPGL